MIKFDKHICDKCKGDYDKVIQHHNDKNPEDLYVEYSCKKREIFKMRFVDKNTGAHISEAKLTDEEIERLWNKLDEYSLNECKFKFEHLVIK